MKRRWFLLAVIPFLMGVNLSNFTPPTILNTPPVLTVCSLAIADNTHPFSPASKTGTVVVSINDSVTFTAVVPNGAGIDYSLNGRYFYSTANPLTVTVDQVGFYDVILQTPGCGGSASREVAVTVQ